MRYDDRPWLKWYDPGVTAEVEVPEIPFGEHFDRIVSEHRGRPALHFHGITLSYRDLQGYANRFANALIENGCTAGDVIGINLPNIPQYLIAQIGAAKVGCAASGLSPLLTAREIAYQLNDSKAKAIVTLGAIFEKRLAGVIEDIPSLKLIISTGVIDFLPWIKRVLGRLLKKVPHGKTWPMPGRKVEDFMSALSRCPDSSPDIQVNVDAPLLVQYTGGTTGVPKGTVLTHRNMATNQTQIENWTKPAHGNEVVLSGFPFFHLAGLAMGLSSVAMGGVQILIPNPRDTGHIVKEMAKYKPTILVNVPSLYMMLLEDPGFRKLDFSRLSFCISGASPFPVESIKELESVVGEGKVVEVYGLTETSPIVTMNPRRGKKKIGSIGLPVSSTRVRLMDIETGTNDVPIGEEGEIVVCGGQVMTGYLNKPEETCIALREHDGDLWLHTGDVGRMDEDGFIYVVDRTKDMLNVGGFKVFSREVEEKLYEHPAIEFCAIVGIPNPKRPGTDRVKLVVQLKKQYKDKSQEDLKADLLAFARENFAPYKVPRVIEIVDSIPLTLVGKVDKKLLR